ncbi:MAG TPA: PKD domain-containing protein, partial [Bacteroidia bacterium]|nr:PKD domain-containing protein [Bacteroidia bacterium]
TPTVTTTYTVSITNSCGIVNKDSAVVRISNTKLTPSSTPAACGNPTGTASVSAAGGINPYTFSWTGGQTSTTATALATGTYTVTSKDSLGCLATATTVVAGTPPLRDSIVSFTNVSVACGANGSALVGVKGGGGTYTYSWNSTPVQTNAQATNLAAGNYTVTVTDNNLCNVTATVTIAQPGALTASIPSTTPVLCNGGSTGTATAGVAGGTGPYTYSWNSTPAQTTSVATALAAGPYTVSITDANNCTVTSTTVITQPAALRDSIAKSTNVLCFGQSNGTAVAGVKGGTGTYSYSWNTAPAQTSSTATALATGTYTVVIIDANGCKDSTTAVITQPAALELTASPFPATCNGTCTGSATVLPSGGTGVYTYVWSNATSATTANVTGLCAGNYSVVVTDGNGCTHDTTNLAVTQPPALVLTKTAPVAAFCNQANGSDNVTIAGGTPPYVYAWSNGQTSTALTGVKPGSYCFGVQDANKCPDSICVIIPNTPGVVANIVSTTTVTCNGGTNGSITGGTTGGTGPFTYSWTTVPAQTNITATGLGAGTYTFNVTDGGTGCQSTATATVTQPALVAATPGPAQTICISQSANITVTAAGGAAPYTYTWMPGGMTGSPATPAPSPTVTTVYTVTTTDVNSCPGATVTVVVNVDQPLSVTTGTPVAICPGKKATITANAKGGNGSYTYTWLPGNIGTQTTTVSPAATGYYTVIASDGCTAPDAIDSMEVIVDPLPVIAFTADTTNGCYPVCVTFTDHSTIASGGLKSWNWSFGDGNSSVQDTPKHCYTVPGAYTVSVTVTSDSGCPSSLSQNNMITVYDHPHTNFSDSPQPTDITSPTINFTDQTTDLYGITHWLWNFGDPVDPNNISITKDTLHTYSDTGTYCIKLIDINKHGCVDSITHCVVIDPLFTFYIPDAFTPNADGVNDVFIPKGTYFTTFEMYIFNRWGTPIYHCTDINKPWNGSVSNGSVMCQEDTYIYVIKVNDFKGTQHSYTGKVTLLK